MINHGGHQGATHDATGNKSGERHSERRAEAQPSAGDPSGSLPPGVIWQIATQRGADGGPQLSIKCSQQVLTKKVTVDTHVVHEIGHVSALPGENHLRGGMINAGNGGAHLVAGANRLLGLSIDMLTSPKG